MAADVKDVILESAMLALSRDFMTTATTFLPHLAE